MTFGNAIEILAPEFQIFELRPQGFFNVESGGFSITNGFYEPCDCSVENFGNSLCQECGRGKNQSSVTFPSGDGDGIYVAFAIVLPGQQPGEEDETVGLIAVFDYQYEIANYVRISIEKGELPEFPWELVSKFSNNLALTIGSLQVDKTLLIGEKSFSVDDVNAVVDFPDAISGTYNCVAYCKEVSTTARGIAERMSSTQGMPREEVEREARIAAEVFNEMRDEEGIDEDARPFPPFIPRVIVALHERFNSPIGPVGTTDEIDDVDWKLLQRQFKSCIVTAHKGQMNISAIWQNALLAREYDRAVVECSNEVAKKLMFNSLTWLYQGRQLGDEDCINLLDKYTYQPDDDEEIYLYMRRGMQSAAAKLL
jgi:hypothetical protein